MQNPLFRRGFTLLELIIVVTVVSILLGIGVPSLREMRLNARMTANTNHLIGMLHLTRSEALRRHVRVVMCRSSDQQSCDGDETRIWENGWIIFSDLNRNGQIDIDQGEQLIRVAGPLPGGMTLRSGGNYKRHLAYLPDGRPRGSGGLGTNTFTLCDQRGWVHARRVITSATGRVRTEPGNKDTDCP